MYSLTNCPDEEWDNKFNKMEFASTPSRVGAKT